MYPKLNQLSLVSVYEDLLAALERFDLSEYFGNISIDEFVSFLLSEKVPTT